MSSRKIEGEETTSYLDQTEETPTEWSDYQSYQSGQSDTFATSPSIANLYEITKKISTREELKPKSKSPDESKGLFTRQNFSSEQPGTSVTNKPSLMDEKVSDFAHNPIQIPPTSTSTLGNPNFEPNYTASVEDEMPCRDFFEISPLDHYQGNVDVKQQESRSEPSALGMSMKSYESNRIKVVLNEIDKWKEMAKLENEMMLNNTNGRRLDPPIEVYIYGLEPFKRYAIRLKFEPNKEYSWNRSARKWNLYNRDDDALSFLPKTYNHPKSNELGRNLNGTNIGFDEVLLCTMRIQESKDERIELITFVKYTPVVEIFEVCKPAERILRKSAKLHEAAFIAVTTIHNDELRKWKKYGQKTLVGNKLLSRQRAWWEDHTFLKSSELPGPSGVNQPLRKWKKYDQKTPVKNLRRQQIRQDQNTSKSSEFPDPSGVNQPTRASMMYSQPSMMPSQSSMVPSQLSILSSLSYTVPSQSFTMPSQSPTMPSQSSMMPSQLSMMHAQSSMIPSQSSMIPSQSSMMHAQSFMIPSQSSMIPSQSSMIPSQSSMMHAQSYMIPSQSSMMPSQLSSMMHAQSSMIPSQSSMIPSQSSMMHAQLSMIPSQSSMIPSQSSMMHAQSSMMPSQSSMMPSQLSSMMHAQSSMIPSQSSMMHAQSSMIPSQSSMMPSQLSSMMHSQSSMIPSQSSMIPSQSSMMHAQSSMIPSQSSMIPSQSSMMHAQSSMMPSQSSMMPSQSSSMMHAQSSMIPSQLSMMHAQSSMMPSQSSMMPSQFSSMMHAQSSMIPSQSSMMHAQSSMIPSQSLMMPSQLSSMMHAQSSMIPSHSSIISSPSSVMPSQLSSMMHAPSTMIPSQSSQMALQSSMMPDQSFPIHSQSSMVEPFMVQSFQQLLPTVEVPDATQIKSNLQVTLRKTATWQVLAKFGHEMIIDTRGKRMFPPLVFNVLLHPVKAYEIRLKFQPISKLQWNKLTKKFDLDGPPECTTSKTYTHPDSGMNGTAWSMSNVEFPDILLSLISDSRKQQIIALSNYHKYQPVLEIVEMDKSDQCSELKVCEFSFEETAFIAVLAFHNKNVLALNTLIRAETSDKSSMKRKTPQKAGPSKKSR